MSATPKTSWRLITGVSGRFALQTPVAKEKTSRACTYPTNHMRKQRES